MKTITIFVSMLFSTIAFSQSINENISLAGNELLKYQKKQKTSMLMVLGGAGLAIMGAKNESAKPMIIIGGLFGVVGVTINISSLSNLRKSSKHLIKCK